MSTECVVLSVYIFVVHVCSLAGSGPSTPQCIHHALYNEARERAGCEPSPSAAVIDSQSVKTTKSGGPRSYDAAKKVTGRKGYGIELDPKYCDVIVKRRDQVAKLKATHAETGKTFAELETDRTTE